MHPRQAGLVAALLVAFGGVATFASAQQPAATPPPAPAPSPATQSPATNTAPATAKADGAETTAPDAGRKPAAAPGSPQHFEPTEKVRPDFDVAFPVDI